MDTSIDYYATLGVSTTATRSEIKAEWSQLVQRFHPDMGDEADPTRFMEVQKAFDVLGDESTRLEYDSARNASTAGADSEEPGWGEAAPAQSTRANPKVSREDWVPPHLRPEPEPQKQQPAAAPPARPPENQTPSQPAPRVAQQKESAHPKPHPSWRIAVNPDQKVKLSRGWTALWLPPTVAAVISLIVGLMAIREAGEGVLGAATPALAGLVMLVTVCGVFADWTRAQNGTNSAVGAMVSCVVGVVAGLTGFMAGNNWLVAAAVFTCGAGILMVQALHYKYVVTRQMPAKQLRKFAAFGKPGKHASSGVLQIVERDLADKLNELFAIASVRLFHGLGVPATRSEERSGEAVTTMYGAKIINGGYVGQAVTAGKRVALLSSVVWPAGRYTVDQYGGVCIDGQHTQYEVEPFIQDFKHWKDHLRGTADVRLIVVVHSDGPVTVDMPGLPIDFVPANAIVDTLGTWLVDEQGTADRKVNAVMAEHLAAG